MSGLADEVLALANKLAVLVRELEAMRGTAAGKASGTTVPVHAADYVTIPLFACLSGYSEKAIRAKIYRGVWRDGAEYVKAPDGHVLMSTKGYAAWAASHQNQKPRAARGTKGAATASSSRPLAKMPR